MNFRVSSKSFSYPGLGHKNKFILRVFLPSTLDSTIHLLQYSMCSGIKGRLRGNPQYKCKIQDKDNVR